MKSGIFCGIATFAISMVYCWQNLVDAKKTKEGFHLVHQTTQPNLGLYTHFFYQLFLSSISTQPHSMAKTHSSQNSKHP
jgi:hypothetical protein